MKETFDEGRIRRSCNRDVQQLRRDVLGPGIVTQLSLVPQIAWGVTSDEACVDAFRRELNYVFRTLRRFRTSRSEVEDLAQEVFLALRQTWSEYDSRRPLRPYLFGIAFRVASAHYRKRRREVAHGTVELADSRQGPDAAVEEKQTRAMMLAALEKIPLPRRAVLVMHEIDDVPVRQVASVLGIPRFTAYSRLRKGRRELEAAVRQMLTEADREWVSYG